MVDPEDFFNPELKQDYDEISSRLYDKIEEEYNWSDVENIDEDVDSKGDAFRLGLLRGRMKTASNLVQRLGERSAIVFTSKEELEEKLQDYYKSGLFVSKYNPPENIKIGYKWTEFPNNPIREVIENIEDEDPSLEEVIEEADLGLNLEKTDEGEYKAIDIDTDANKFEYAPVFIVDVIQLDDKWVIDMDFEYDVWNYLSNLERGHDEEIPVTS